MNEINRFSGVARLLDPRYPTNRGIMILAAIVVVLGSGYQIILGKGWVDGLSWGLGFGVGAFLAWALAREIDPDYELAAFVAAGLSLLGALLPEPPNLLLLFWALLALRIVNRTTGQPATILDVIAALALTGWLVLRGEWILGLAMGIAFAGDALLRPTQRRSWLFAGLALVLTVIALIRSPWNVGSLMISPPVLVGVVAMSAMFVPVIIWSQRVVSTCDWAGQPLNPRRIQVAQVVALSVAVIQTVLKDLGGLADLSPLWAALLGVSLYRFYSILIQE